MGSLSDTILTGTPCNLTISEIKALHTEMSCKWIQLVRNELIWLICSQSSKFSHVISVSEVVHLQNPWLYVPNSTVLAIRDLKS